MAKITFSVDDELKDQLLKLAEESEVSLSELIRSLIQFSLKSREERGVIRRVLQYLLR